MTMTSTPSDSGTGLNDAQAQIERLLAPEYGDTQEGEGEGGALQGGAEDSADPNENVDDDDLEAGEHEEEGDDLESEGEEDDSDDDDREQEIQTVEIDGTQIPLEEVKKGYLRQADYTRKTQELAEQRKSLNEHGAAVAQERQQYAALLPQLARMIETGGKQEPDWDTLFKQDPIGAVQRKHEWDREVNARREYQAAIEAEQQRVLEAQQREQIAHLQETVAQEREKLLEKLPRWKDPAVAKAEREQVKAFAKEIGFTEDELAAVTDHRAVYGLYMAMKYAGIKARRDKLTPRRTVRPMKPGEAPEGKTDLRRKKTVVAKQRLAESGSVQDAAFLIEQTL